MTTRTLMNARDTDENEERSNIMRRAGVGKNSDLRRKNSEGNVMILKRSPSKKIGNEIIL